MIIEMFLYINDDSLQLLKGEVHGTQRLLKGLLYIFYQPLVHPSLPWQLDDHPRPRSPRYKGVKLPLKFFSRLSFGQLQMHRPGSRASEHQHVSFLFPLVHFLF